MANHYYRKPNSGKPPDTGHKGSKGAVSPEKTAAWPGAPGPTQPNDRDEGSGIECDESRYYVKSEGI